MADISNILKSLTQLGMVDFSGQKEKFLLFAQKYDKNNNSIFESDELEALKEDFFKFAGEDGNAEDLSEEEGLKFYKSLFQVNNSAGKQETGNAQTTKTSVTENTQQTDVTTMANDLINLSKEKLIATLSENRNFSSGEIKELKSLSFEELKRVKSLSSIENRDTQLETWTILYLSKLSGEEYERAKSLLYVENRDEQFSYISEFDDLLKLSDEEFDRAKTLLYVENRDKQLSSKGIAELSKLTDEEYERAKSLLYVEGRDKQIYDSEIAELSKLSDKEYERAKSLLYVENRDQQFYGFEIAELSKLTDEEYERAKSLLYVENRKKQFDAKEIIGLSNLSDEQYNLAKTLFNVTGRENEEEFNGYDIAELASLSKEEYARAKTLFNVENREKQFNGHEISALAKLSDKQLKRAKTLFNVKGRDKQFNGIEIAELAKLSDVEFERAKTLFNVAGRKVQFSGSEISKLSKLSDEEFKRARKLFNGEKWYSGDALAELSNLSDEEFNNVEKILSKSNRYFDGYQLVCLAKNYCPEIEKLLDSNCDVKLLRCDENENYHCKIINKKNDYYLLDNAGRFEHVIEQDEPTRTKIVINEKLKMKQEIVYDDKKNVTSETITYYDENNNVIKIVTTKKDPETGHLNVSEIDKDGNVIPVQWESTNPETGAKITERNLTSPNGDKTEFYCEESENLKITDYTITDKDGKTLADIHQTFEKISDNKYISSINATGKDKDTKIYEIEYTDDYKIKILDKKNNKTTVIDLKEYIKDDESMQKLLPVLKQLPGQVLLEFAEKPTLLKFDENKKHNGEWSTWENSIEIENWGDAANENDAMLSVMTHELGHYLDGYHMFTPKLAQNKELMAIYKEELKVLQKSTTITQQGHISYFTDGVSDARASEERLAETHSILYSTNSSSELDMRRLYFAQYFPRTMAKAMELLLNEEGVKV